RDGAAGPRLLPVHRRVHGGRRSGLAHRGGVRPGPPAARPPAADLPAGPPRREPGARAHPRRGGRAPRRRAAALPLLRRRAQRPGGDPLPAARRRLRPYRRGLAVARGRRVRRWRDDHSGATALGPGLRAGAVAPPRPRGPAGQRTRAVTGRRAVRTSPSSARPAAIPPAMVQVMAEAVAPPVATSGGTVAPARNCSVPSSAEAVPARSACGSIASAVAFGMIMPMPNTVTKIPGSRPGSPQPNCTAATATHAPARPVLTPAVSMRRGGNRRSATRLRLPESMRPTALVAKTTENACPLMP